MPYEPIKRLKNGIEYRYHEKFNYVSRFGKSTCDIVCPFCKLVTMAYVWSLAGSGKRCDNCGVKHTSFGITIDDKNAYRGRAR